MKRKASLPELVEELKNQALKKKDFVIPASNMLMENGKLIIANQTGSNSLKLLLRDTGISMNDYNRIELKCMPICDGNLSDKLGIPKKYFDKMRHGHIDLLDKNVTHWLNNSNSNYFIRSFIDQEEKSGYARAMLSYQFFVMDNYDVLMACLEAVKESNLNLQIADCDITEKKMYVRFIAPDIQIDAPEILKNYKVPNSDGTGGVNNGIISGFVISNSEVGQGQFSIAPRALVLACSNGMVRQQDAMKKTHLGTKMEQYSSFDWSKETMKKNYELICSQVKDAIKTYCSEGYLGTWIQQLQEQGQHKLENPLDCVRNVAKHLSISEEKERDILNYFIEGADLTGFGVTQAITYYAHECDSADEQYDMEQASVTVLGNIKQFDKPTKKKNIKTAAKFN